MNINVELEHYNETENLKINLDEIEFVDIIDVENELKEQQVYDLVLKNTPNYILSNGGIVHNGGGKRKGAFAIYLEPWHADVNDFLELKKNHGKEEVRARDLFYALWVPDLFMKRVKEQGQWTLMCPHECPGLADVWGDEFEALYTKYESEGRGRQTIQAVDLWYKIIESQFETGMPYILYKDAANRKSNQQNLGTIKSSNLCLTGDTIVNVRLTKEDDTLVETDLTLKNVVSLDFTDNLRSIKKIEVLSYNIEKKVNEYKLITNAALTNPKIKVIQITDNKTGKVIKCTEDHQIYTVNRGYVLAKYLTEDDELLIN